MEYKAVPLGEPQIEDERVVKSLYAVMGNTDAYNDIIAPGAFTKTIKERLPTGEIKVLWNHDMYMPPVATVQTLKEISKADLPEAVRARFPDASGALYGEVRFLDTPRGNEVLAGIKSGAITQNSIGFDPIKFDIEKPRGEQDAFMDPFALPRRTLKEVKLYDVSPVNFPANPAAVVVKAALPFKATAMAPEDAAWDGPEVMAMCEGRDQLRTVCAWVDPEGDPEVKSSYKLPHHLPNGEVVWRGVAAAMGALLGSQGGVSLPDADRQGVYNHLAKHYDQFSKTPPEFKTIELAHQVRLITIDDFKAGRVLSAANLDKLKAALATLSDILLAAEPPADESQKALTGADYLRRIELAALEFDLLTL